MRNESWTSHGGPWPWSGMAFGRRARFFESGEVRLAILSLLSEGPKHGYQLMKEMEGELRRRETKLGLAPMNVEAVTAENAPVADVAVEDAPVEASEDASAEAPSGEETPATEGQGESGSEAAPEAPETEPVP